MDEDKTSSAKPKTKRAASAKKPAPKAYVRPRGGEAKAVADLVPQIGRAAFRRFGFVQSSVVSRWDEIVGARYAAVSAPELIRFPLGKKADGTLELLVEGAHAPMMQHVFPEIIERVNRFFGYNAIARIKMRQGAVSAPVQRKRPEPAPILKPVAMELGESLRNIADPELFAVLESLAQSMTRKDDLAKSEE